MDPEAHLFSKTSRGVSIVWVFSRVVARYSFQQTDFELFFIVDTAYLVALGMLRGSLIVGSRRHKEMTDLFRNQLLLVSTL